MAVRPTYKPIGCCQAQGVHQKCTLQYNIKSIMGGVGMYTHKYDVQTFVLPFAYVHFLSTTTSYTAAASSTALLFLLKKHHEVSHPLLHRVKQTIAINKTKKNRSGRQSLLYIPKHLI